jgi:hypothetical protein
LVTFSFLADDVLGVVVDVVDEDDVVVVVVVVLAGDEQPAKVTAPNATIVASLLFSATRTSFASRKRSVSGGAAAAMAGSVSFKG